MNVADSYWKLIQVLEIRGYSNSVETQLSVNAKGEPLPWLAYPAIDYLSALDLSQYTVFEFGAGYSTLFWAKRCKSVTSVESNREWYQTMASAVPDNCKLMFRDEEEAYLRSLDEQQSQFDLIVIDGALNRRKMAEVALRWIAKGGFILLDNSDCHVKAAKVLRDADLIQIDFTGFGPIVWHELTTSIFLTRDFRPKPIGPHQPQKSVGNAPLRG